MTVTHMQALNIKISHPKDKPDYYSIVLVSCFGYSMTVKIGPRDYWSKRMSEYTGKRHRVLFDETLEKIYNRLYREATNSS